MLPSTKELYNIFWIFMNDASHVDQSIDHFTVNLNIIWQQMAFSGSARE